MKRLSAPTLELYSLCCERNPRPTKVGAKLSRLIKAGADVLATDKNGVTPLHFAVRFRNPAAVAALLRHGANVNRQCQRSGSTPLHRAVTWSGAPATAGKCDDAREIIEILLRHGADPAIKNRLGKTAADYVRDPNLRRILMKRTASAKTRSPSR